MTVRLRGDLSSLPSYIPGVSRPNAIKLASNESTAASHSKVVEAITQAAQGINRYPDNGAGALTDALADFLGVDPANLVTGCGSVALCQELIQITCESPEDEVVFAWRSFEAYPIVTKVAGATGVPVPLRSDHSHDLGAMLAAINDRTRLILVCNPNNPTGTVVTNEDLTHFLDAVPSDILVVLDEAYAEYVRDPDSPNGIELFRTRPNVLVLRTFSKAYGLAGIRVGYGVGAPEIIDALRKVHLPFSVNAVAQAAALAALEVRDELLERTNDVVAERERVSAALTEMGYPVAQTQANFVYLPLGEASVDFARRSAEAGVIIRPYGTDGVRITIGDPHENDAFLSFARTVSREFA
ncbi:MAG: histidinol-phosphate transaminase [Nocardiaceae bacterium]|nr:histidinol-phosphate transaminase [Nocardiaceae bacterium]